MKNILKITLLTISILTLSQCKDDDDKPDKPNYGAEYFKCKVNGVELDTQSNFSCNGKYFNYYPEAYFENPPGRMTFYGGGCTEYEVVGIRINGVFQDTDHLSFINPTTVDSVSPYYSIMDSVSGTIITYETVLAGEMTIEQFIPRADGSSPYGTIKGTFYFTVTDTNATDTFRITNGSFRFDVPQIF